MTHLQTITNTVVDSTQELDRLAGATETLLLTLATRAAAWLSTIPTIALTARTIETGFALEPTAALLSSIALEVVGQSTVTGWLKACEYEEGRRQTDTETDTRLALALMLGYFAADFALVGALEIPNALTDWRHITALIFPALQVISTLATAQRAQIFNSIEARAAEKRARATKRAARQRRVSDAPNDARDAADAPLARQARATDASKADFDAYIASLNGERASLTRDEVYAWASTLGMDMDNKPTRDKVTRWCRSINL